MGRINHPPVVPPTRPVAPSGPPPMPATRWPIIVGVIAIVLGALGVLNSMFQLAMPVLARFAASLGPLGAMATSGVARYSMPNTVASILAGTVWSGCVVLGIRLVRRRPLSNAFIVAWVVLRFASVVLVAMVGYFIQVRSFEGVTQGSGRPSPAFFQLVAALGVATNLVFNSIWPAFLLWWFAREPIRAEIHAWSAQGIR